MSNAKFRDHCERLELKMKTVWFKQVSWSINQLIDLLEYRLGYGEKKDHQNVLHRLELAKQAWRDLYNATHVSEEKEVG